MIDIETPPGLMNLPAAEQGIYPPPPEISDTGYQTKSHYTQHPPGMQAYGHQAHTSAQGREHQGQMAPTLPQGPTTLQWQGRMFFHLLHNKL